MEEVLRSFWKRSMLGFCRSMFSLDLGHRNAEEALKRTWREFGAFAAEALKDGSAEATPRAAAELDRKLAELLGARVTVIPRGEDEVLSCWEACPLWEETKKLWLQKAFTCVGACDELSAELARAVGEGVEFERGSQLPKGQPCEKIWRRR